MAFCGLIAGHYQRSLQLRLASTLTTNVGWLSPLTVPADEKAKLFEDYSHILRWLSKGIGMGCLPSVAGLSPGHFPPSCPFTHRIVEAKMERMLLLDGSLGN
jgi:hypothetical protein